MREGEQVGRVRTVVGLLAVVVGTAWLLGGPEALRSGARVALMSTPYLLMTFAAVLIVRTALPKGRRSAPSSCSWVVGCGLWPDRVG